MKLDRDTRTLAITAILAVGAPVAVGWWIQARTAELADQLGAASGVRATIGTVDADLSGAVRLEGVAFGDIGREIIRADAIEASVGMGSLLDGQLRADEIRVDGPHVEVSVESDGDSDLARLARRLRGHKSTRALSSGGGHQIRRIVVVDGTLVARIAGIGELTADQVELIPDSTGIRIVTGALRVRGGDDARDLHFDLTFGRSAAEVTHQLKFGRVLAVGGSGTASAGTGATLALRDLTAGRRGAGLPLELLAVVDDNGAPRTAQVEVTGHSTVTIRSERFPLRAFAALAPAGLDLGDARATGTLTVARTPGGLHVATDASFEHLVVADPRLSADPVPLSFAMSAEVVVTADVITVPRARFLLPPNAATPGRGESPPLVEISANGWIRRGKPVSGQLELTLATAPCATLLAALPAPIRGPLDGMAITGNGGGKGRLLVDLAAPEGEGATLTLAGVQDGGCTVTTEPPLADVASLAQVIDQQLADGSRIHTGPGEANWTFLKSLPWYVMGAFVSAEDGRFWEHPGFDLDQIARSLEIDLREHRLARGGSTISQQLVKNAFLSQRRSFDRKLQEAILTWRLEARLDKKQILERYLNIIELGPKIWGLRAAAKYYFNVSPRELTVKQAAFLAALTSQPTSMSRRVRRAGGLDPVTTERVLIVLGAMRRDGVIDEPTWLDARLQRLGFAATAVPPDR